MKRGGVAKGYIKNSFFYERYHLDYSDAIQTNSNLNSDVLFDIVTSLGLDYQPFESKPNFIDKWLLSTRTEIAHGQYLEFDHPAYVELSDEVLQLLDMFKTQIENAVTEKNTSRRTTPARAF